MRKTIRILAIAAALCTAAPMSASAGRTVNIGEYQRGKVNLRSGDTVNVFMAKRDTAGNWKKCDHWGGKGLILVTWRGRTWEVCVDPDF